MRITTVFRRLLGVIKLYVSSVEFDSRGLCLGVRPSWFKPRCGRCGKRAPGYDRLQLRRWRHLGIGGTGVWLQYAPRRVRCSSCGVCVESVPWADHQSRFTWDFEELVAYLAQITDKTQVTRLMGIAWTTVGKIVERVVARKLESTRLENLKRIGVDEFGYRKRHRYLTLVVDHDRRRVVWAAEGRTSAVLRQFFDHLGPERCAGIECVTMDLALAYMRAVESHLPNAQIVCDRFHVQRLASDALDEVRRDQLRTLRGTPEGREIFRSRFALLKNPWDLSAKESQKLSDIERSNRPLYRAYTLKEALAHALDYKQPARAKRALKEWLAWASRSRLKPFVQVARTIREYFDRILAYVGHRLTNALVEGFNARLRMIARRAFGFHSAGALIGMLYLCCGGIKLSPPLP